MFHNACEMCGRRFRALDSDESLCPECWEEYDNLAQEGKFYEQIEGEEDV